MPRVNEKQFLKLERNLHRNFFFKHNLFSSQSMATKKRRSNIIKYIKINNVDIGAVQGVYIRQTGKVF